MKDCFVSSDFEKVIEALEERKSSDWDKLIVLADWNDNQNIR
jgi:hypothetical protein